MSESSGKLGEVSINIVAQIEPPGDIPTGRLEKAIRWIVGQVGRGAGASVSIVLAADETVHALNRQYRGVDRPTDVLSFPAEDADFADEPELGDLILALPYLERQAQAEGHTFADELLLAVIHGTLHLLGYDHDTLANQDAMWAIQEQALAAAGVAIVVPRFSFDDDGAGDADTGGAARAELDGERS